MLSPVSGSNNTCISDVDSWDKPGEAKVSWSNCRTSTSELSGGSSFQDDPGETFADCFSPRDPFSQSEANIAQYLSGGSQSSSSLRDWKEDDPARRTCQPGTSPTIPERGKQGRLREGGKLGSAQVVRQVCGDEADLRPRLDISWQVRLARWGEVPGQGCGELEVSTPVAGTDGLKWSPGPWARVGGALGLGRNSKVC